MRFKQWFETMTSTSSVAVFARPMMGMVSRSFPDTFNYNDKPKKKEKEEEKERLKNNAFFVIMNSFI